MLLTTIPGGRILTGFLAIKYPSAVEALQPVLVLDDNLAPANTAKLGYVHGCITSLPPELMTAPRRVLTDGRAFLSFLLW